MKAKLIKETLQENSSNSLNEKVTELEYNKTRIELEILMALEKYKKNPENFFGYYVSKLKQKLLQQAKENNYRGTVIIRKSHDDPRSKHANKLFIVYKPKDTTMETIGKIVAHER